MALPVVAVEQLGNRRAADERADAGDALPSSRGRLAGLRVLIVDDDDDARALAAGSP